MGHVQEGVHALSPNIKQSIEAGPRHQPILAAADTSHMADPTQMQFATAHCGLCNDHAPAIVWTGR